MKDVMGVRLAMKHPHSSPDREEAVGMTEFRVGGGGGGGLAPSPGGAAPCSPTSRPTGVIKWAFDDYIVEEVWSDDAFDTGAPADPPGPAATEEARHPAMGPVPACFGIEVLCEGVPDPTIASMVWNRLPASRFTRVEFATPVDFLSSQRRLILVYFRHDPEWQAAAAATGGKSSSRTVAAWKGQVWRAFPQEQHFRVAGGLVVLGKARLFKTAPGHDGDPAAAGASTTVEGPLSTAALPDLRYSLLIRGVDCSLAHILPRLESLQRCGFLNYAHAGRHGYHLSQVANQGRLLLQRRYPQFLCAYINSLTEGSPLIRRELPFFTELILREEGSAAREWSSICRQLQQVIQKETARLSHCPQSGLYVPHLSLLSDVVEKTAVLMARRHDSAQVIRESVSPLVLRESLRALTDVHFNAVLSARWKRYGDQVVVGDLVLRSPSASWRVDGLDAYEGAADHINGELIHPANVEWPGFPSSPQVELADRVCVVATEKEASQYSVTDVVLPLWGAGVADLPLHPQHACGRELVDGLASALSIDGLPHMRLAPAATYRRAVVIPRDVNFAVFNEQRGWVWESSDVPVGDARGQPLRPSLYADDEGIIRQPSPLLRASHTKRLARFGLGRSTAGADKPAQATNKERGLQAAGSHSSSGGLSRADFVRSARRSGAIFCLQMTLPRGSAVTSALREVIHYATVSPTAIVRLLR